ncbi:MAG: hypothetical protein KF701_05180 [Anaerolineales bacterium]|nr:MAG: hypothetical protein KF701_05180 [Anaerolineales bacterium]
MPKQLLRLLTTLIVLLAAMVYPYLPGRYDANAVALSTVVQVFSIAGMLLVPIGVLWLAYAARLLSKNRSEGSQAAARRRFAVVALVACVPVALLTALAAFATGGMLLGLVVLAGFVLLLARQRRRLQQPQPGFDATPLALLLPGILLLAQLGLAGPLTEFSRNRAIANSAEMLRDIEAYRAQNGSYPGSLAAVWHDYAPGVAGIAKYHYVAAGDGFNLFFEQPLFILDNFGAREFVVYNPLGQHSMISHDSWILLLSPSRVLATQGWFQVNDAGGGWRYFWFD